MMNETEMTELRLKCRKLDREIQIEKMDLIDGIMNRIVMATTRDIQYLDWLIVKRDAIKDIVKWY